MNIVRKLFQSIKSRGLFNTIFWILFGYLKTNRFLVFYRSLEQHLDYSFPDNNIEIKQISIDQLIHYRNREKKLPIEFYSDEIENFKTPFVAFVDNHLAAIIWIVAPGENSRFFNLKKGDIETNNKIILPHFRGKKLQEQFTAFIIKRCKELGYKRMFSAVHVDNISAYKHLLRLGFEPVEIVIHFGWSRPKATLKYVK